MLVLTGNSSNRIKQLYLTNPNIKYPVTIEIMIANIDDSYSLFNDINQSATTFTGLEWTDIKSHVVGESIKIMDKSTTPRPLIYLEINNIEIVEKSGNILIISDSSYGSIFLQFLTEFDTYQTLSLFNNIIENPNIDIDNILVDLIGPVITFYNQVGNSLIGDYISFNGATAGPYSTNNGLTFSTSISITDWGTASMIDKEQLIYLLIDNIVDNRDGTMSIQPSNLTIASTSSSIENIILPGTYSLTLNLSDIANNIQSSVINLTIT